MKEKLNKKSYSAPKMEATSFRTENGYAGSVSATNVTITMSGGTL